MAVANTSYNTSHKATASCQWSINKTNIEYVNYIARIASISTTTAQVLINRGIKTHEQVSAFLSPNPSLLSDPFELPGIKAAVERLKEAKRLGERVLIIGDYDADGVTATAIMVLGLRKIGIDVYYFIPDRIAHGYGFGMAGVDNAKAVAAKLIITVDCGITSFDATKAANSLGMDVIITDHHEPVRQNIGPISHISPINFILPAAQTIINPKISCPELTLSGAGVAFKLMQGLFENNIDDIYELFDLAAIGTSADMVSMQGDSRIIATEGIKLIRSAHRAGIRALKAISGIKDQDSFRTSSLYFALIPRINAAGRIANAADVVRLLTTSSDSEAEELSIWLNNLNSERQKIERAVYDEAKERVQLSGGRGQGGLGAIVVAGERWHPGVVGIVASRIAEEYYLPTFVLSCNNGVASGSARSIPSFDIHGGLAHCKDILKRFGGHKQAAGLSLSSEDILPFRAIISDIVLNTLSTDDFVPTLNIDAAVNLSDINTALINEIAGLEPFGYGNEEPLFGAKGLEAIQPRIVGSNHLKMLLRQNWQSMGSIGFDLGGLLNTITTGELIDVAFMPLINEYNGGRYLQLSLKAVRKNMKNAI